MLRTDGPIKNIEKQLFLKANEGRGYIEYISDSIVTKILKDNHRNILCCLT